MNPVRDARKVIAANLSERAERASSVSAAGQKNKVRPQPTAMAESEKEVEISAEIVCDAVEDNAAAEAVADINARFNASFTEQDAAQTEKDDCEEDIFSEDAATFTEDEKLNCEFDNMNQYEADWQSCAAEEAINEGVAEQDNTADFEIDSEVEEENPYEKLAAANEAKKAAEKENEAKEFSTDAQMQTVPQPYQLPELDLLDHVPERKGGNPAALAKRAKILENLLADFKIQGRLCILKEDRGLLSLR